MQLAITQAKWLKKTTEKDKNVRKVAQGLNDMLQLRRNAEEDWNISTFAMTRRRRRGFQIIEVKEKNSEENGAKHCVIRGVTPPNFHMLERHWPLQSNVIKRIRLQYSKEKGVSPMHQQSCTQRGETFRKGTSHFWGKHNSLSPVFVHYPHPETASRTWRQRRQTNCHHIAMVPKKHGIQPYKSVLH